MPSFDTVLEPNLVEIRNAVDQSSKEVGTRFDFKGTSARVELKDKVSKRGVDVRFIDRSAKIEKIGGDKVRQVLKIKEGVDSDTARKLQTLIKQSKLKVQASIQGDVVRITGAKRDDLQAAIALIRKEIADAPLSFTNFRD
jgi:hypothetical protein